MALPKVEYPLYEIYIKSLDRKVKFRPFLVKEEKILLIAKEAKDPESIKLAISQIIRNCLSEDGVDVEHLPLFDIEMIFLKLRAKSIGESVKLSFNCQNVLEDGSYCNADTDYTLNLENVHYAIPEGHNSKVMLTDKVGVKLKYPTLSTPTTKENVNEFDMMLESLLANIEYTFDAESVYRIEDSTEAELITFIESLTPESLEQIAMFFATTPKVVLEDKVTCKKCGFVHTLHTESLLDFFT
jgi:hypothetical protein